MAPGGIRARAAETAYVPAVGEWRKLNGVRRTKSPLIGLRGIN